MTVILELGRFLEADAQGWFVNRSKNAQLQPEWRPALEALTASSRREVGESFHSFYVRGSVASGAAVKGSSDLDAVLVVEDDHGERRPTWQQAHSARLLAGSPFITDVEVVVLGRGALLAAAADPGAADPVMAQWCFLLALWGRCLEGADLLDQLGRFRPGREVAHVLRSLPSDLRQFEVRLAEARAQQPGPAVEAELRRLCVWTCKKLLRSGAELAMLGDGRFTRDLAPCSLRFAERFPELGDTARRLLEWAIAPPTDLSALEQIAGQLEPVLTRAAEQEGVGGATRKPYLGK